jgi:y4mF family transcriptional regulator
LTLVRISTAEELGRYLRERRRGLGLTQAQLAEQAGVSRRWLSDLEAGKERAEVGLVMQTLHTLSTVIDLQPEESTGEINLDDFLDDHRTRQRRPIGSRRRSAPHTPAFEPEPGGPAELPKDRR